MGSVSYGSPRWDVKMPGLVRLPTTITPKMQSIVVCSKGNGTVLKIIFKISRMIYSAAVWWVHKSYFPAEFLIYSKGEIFISYS